MYIYTIYTRSFCSVPECRSLFRYLTTRCLRSLVRLRLASFWVSFTQKHSMYGELISGTRNVGGTFFQFR